MSSDSGGRDSCPFDIFLNRGLGFRGLGVWGFDIFLNRGLGFRGLGVSGGFRF